MLQLGLCVFASPSSATEKHQPDAVGLGDGDDAERQQPRRHFIQEPEHPDGDHHEGEQHRIEDPDDGEFEACDLNIRRDIRDLDLTEKVALADPQAASAQEIVGGCGVKIEVGECEVQEIRLTFEANLLAAQLERDVPVSEPSMSAGLKVCTKLTVLAMRCLSAAKLASSSA